MNDNDYFIEEHRGLSNKERDLIHWLLVEADHPEFQEQVVNTEVVSKCSCGCPTIDLKVLDFTQTQLHLRLSASGFSENGVPVGIILHIRSGLLSELEIYSENGEHPFGLPDIDTLKVF
jgi:hypothetical protein